MNLDDMTLIDFSIELLHCIFSFCSPSDLVTFSQVNSTFQHAAEYLLYQQVHSSVTSVYNGDEWQSLTRLHKLLFRTLASNPKKVALLRSLHVQLQMGHTNIYGIADDDSIMAFKQISDVLQNAHGLLDLRIHVHEHTESLNWIIRSCHFQLHTLYTYSLWDLEEIIAGQKHLRLLGIHYPERLEYRKFSQIVNYLYHTSRTDDNRELSEIFLFSTEFDSLSQLILFPEFCLPGQASTVCRDIAISLDQDLCNRYKISAGPYPKNCRLAIDIFDFTHTKTSTICEMVEAMAQWFPGCEAFTMLAQNSAVQGIASKPWRIPGFLTSISRFERLCCLCFYVSGDGSLLQATMDLGSFAKELVPVCPTLKNVLVYNHSEHAYLPRCSGWEPERGIELLIDLIPV